MEDGMVVKLANTQTLEFDELSVDLNLQCPRYRECPVSLTALSSANY